ncbi:hypothetical protein ACRRTK_023088 [Alexandromys fortis]
MSDTRRMKVYTLNEDQQWDDLGTGRVSSTQVEIVGMLQEGEKILSEVFAQLTGEATDDEKRCELVNLFKEFCAFSQTLQPQNRDFFFFETLAKLRILPALEIVMGMNDLQTSYGLTDVHFLHESSDYGQYRYYIGTLGICMYLIQIGVMSSIPDHLAMTSTAHTVMQLDRAFGKHKSVKDPCFGYVSDNNSPYNVPKDELLNGMSLVTQWVPFMQQISCSWLQPLLA